MTTYCEAERYAQIARDARDYAEKARHNANGAQEVAQRILDRLDGIDAALTRLEEGTPIDGIEEALRRLSTDMHAVGKRSPCPTCQFASNALGKPFGCVAFAQFGRSDGAPR